jgi:acyl carrier protein
MGRVGSATGVAARTGLSERRLTGRSSAEIEAWLLTRLRERLGPAAEDIDAHLPFSYYGLDSLDAVALAAELEEWLDVPVTPDVAWDYPTAHAVATYLGSESPPEAEPEAADETVAALLAELEAADPDS